MEGVEDCENGDWICGGEGRSEQQTLDDGEREPLEA